MYEYQMTTEDVMGGFMATMAGVWLVALALSVFLIVVQWKLFTKAGEPGWASIVPFYGSYVFYKIAFGNGWLFLLNCIPIVNVVVNILLYLKLAKSFGQSAGFGVGLIFLNIIFLPILAFGNSTYIGPDGVAKE